MYRNLVASKWFLLAHETTVFTLCPIGINKENIYIAQKVAHSFKHQKHATSVDFKNAEFTSTMPNQFFP